MAAHGARFETKVGMLDQAVGKSDGVLFAVRVLDVEGNELATLLERPVVEEGYWVIKRDLSAFAGQEVYLQLEVGPGEAEDVSWDWAVWGRPAARDAEGAVLLDMLTAFHEAEVGYILDGEATVVGTGVQLNFEAGQDYGAIAWQGEHLDKDHPTLDDSSFAVSGRSVLDSVVFMHPTWDERIGATFVRYRIDLPEGAEPMPDEDYPEFMPRGFQGEIVDGKLRPAPEATTLDPAEPPEDVDLVNMARWSMRYLANNPSKERGYETRFHIMPLQCPPTKRPDEFDPIAVGDTENRMDWEFIHMREMTGSDEAREVEEAIWQRIRSYVRDDGLSWCRPYCLCHETANREEEWAMSWTTGETLVSLVERHKRGGDDELMEQGRKLFHGLRSLATWDTGRAYYVGGLDAWSGEAWLGTNANEQYPSILEPVVRYWEHSGDPEALEFARAFADGQLANLQPDMGACRIREDGSFGGWNSHLHMRPVLGVAHLGALLGEPRYVDYARRVYEHLRSRGTDWGWFPECPTPDRIYSEMCNTADMLDVAVWLARAGHTEYWDHVERYVRNYSVESQWWVTPEYEALYRDIHKDNPAGADEGIELMKRYDGGFLSCLSPNGCAWSRDAGGMNMMGCCPPEGMRTLYSAWSNTVLETERGIEVNLALSRDHPVARVVSFGHDQGRLTVVPKRESDFYLRPPSWAPRGEVKAFVDGDATEPVWKGDYVLFPGAKPDQELTIAYPLVEFTQQLHVGNGDYTYHWLGNTVSAVEPRNELLPIFNEVPRRIPKAEG